MIDCCCCCRERGIGQSWPAGGCCCLCALLLPSCPNADAVGCWRLAVACLLWAVPCSEAWAKFSGMPVVERMLAASRAQVEVAYTKYMAAHDALVVSSAACMRRYM